MAYASFVEKLQLLAVYADILCNETPGDVPGLLRNALSRLNTKKDVVQPPYQLQLPDDYTLDNLRSDILEVMATAMSSSSLADRILQSSLASAGGILSTGANLSMNIPDNKLPTAIYTLLQTTIWAILMRAGADPAIDAVDDDPTELDQTCPHEDAEAMKSKAADRKIMWFMCKKFLSTAFAAERDGNNRRSLDDTVMCYGGRLFTNEEENVALVSAPSSERHFHRIRVPGVVDYRWANGFLISTSQGLFAVGDNDSGRLGVLGERRLVSTPARITFPAAPDVSAHEASLPRHRKHGLVIDMWLEWNHSVIRTPLGLLGAGSNSRTELHTDAHRRVLPSYIHLTSFPACPESATVFVTVGSIGIKPTIAVASNGLCVVRAQGLRLPSLDHSGELPFHVDRIHYVHGSSGIAAMFLNHATAILFGPVPDLFVPFVGAELLGTPTPLSFPWPIRRLACVGSSFYAENIVGEWYAMGSNVKGRLGVGVGQTHVPWWKRLEFGPGLTPEEASVESVWSYNYSMWFTFNNGTTVGFGDNIYQSRPTLGCGAETDTVATPMSVTGRRVVIPRRVVLWELDADKHTVVG
ncbi:hypothetical protein J8273_2896 [Carpediemonas membranifera]|uniref:Uncharacterized protein n=1 Tax=Carpediemonas membranifera TaxID=201153 RepID=A0A8J6E5F5_9EUKA|nr:hypothetical protein J8273_2896 [Carpediemonas membranifera]|eukprot:KAG9395692.1 hypothetical protein J8273_2896 [Carpediemonas membranifera]